jgi:RNA polymerase sigma factor (sigma-70 family)
MTGSKGYREVENSEESSLSFFELFGMETSYVDMQVAGRIVSGLIEHIEPQVHDGEVVGLTIRGVSKEHDEELETILNQMKIYPWVDEESDGTFTFSIENKREANRLAFFDKRARIDTSFKETETDMDSAHSPESVSLAPDPYVFPLPSTTEDPNPRLTYPRTPKIEHAGTDDDDVQETDVWMQVARDNFDQGLPLEGEEVESVPYRKGIDLKLFKNRYHFYKDAIKAPDGELLSWKDHKEVLLAAKHDPEKMKQAVDMSVGLVKMVVDRILKKFSTNEIFDEDDLFQAGMEGLLYGLMNLEERETSPSSYLVPCIEGYIRKVLRTQKRIFAQPHGVADLLSKYRRSQAELEREIPRFITLTREQQEEKIIQRAGLSQKEARSVLTMINAKKESFDEDLIDPELTYREKSLIEAGGDEHERVRQSFSEALETLSIREEIVLRLHFGLMGGTRIKDISEVKDIFTELEKYHLKQNVKEHFQKLYQFDLEKDDFDSLNRAEQMFVALLEKVPESFVANLYNNDPSNPTEITLSEIGSIFGVTGTRVGGILAKAMRTLKHPSRNKKLHDSGYLKKESTKFSWSDSSYERTVIDEREIN